MSKFTKFIKGNIPWNKGISLSEEHKHNLSISHLGKKMPNRKRISAEDRLKLSIAHKGQKPWNTGKAGTYKLSEKHKLAIKNSLKNVKKPKDFRQRCINGARNRKRPIPVSDEHRKHNREAQIRYREKMGFKRQIIGKYETPVLDNLEKCFGYIILRQYKVAGYFLDGYCPGLNLAIEVDEPYHKNEEQLTKDIYREIQIKKEMSCQFLRIDVDNRGGYDSRDYS